MRVNHPCCDPGFRGSTVNEDAVKYAWNEKVNLEDRIFYDSSKLAIEVICGYSLGDRTSNTFKTV